MVEIYLKIVIASYHAKHGADHPHRPGIAWLSGEGVRNFLQDLVTNDLDALEIGHPLWAGLLTPQAATPARRILRG